MSVIATVTLDSGCFLQRQEKQPPYSAEIGYFESENAASEIRVNVDGIEVESPELNKLGKKCVIEVRHKNAGDEIRRDGVRSSATFHASLLHMSQLYDDDKTDAARDKFDCILRFYSGYFRASMVKNRTFKEYRRQTDNSLAYADGNGNKVVQSIAHNVVIQFKLEDGEALELARDDKPLWSSKGAKDRVDIEIIADKSTVEKFYCHAFLDDRSRYWLPNQPDDPPPNCSKPPCNGDPGNP